MLGHEPVPQKVPGALSLSRRMGVDLFYKHCQRKYALRWVIMGVDMISISRLSLGFSDAENYSRRENKELFNRIFIKNNYLDLLLNASTFFLIGEKGTGKTAYAVFLANNDFRDTVSQLKYIRETDYQKFFTLKKEKHLQLSDYSSIWKVIIMLLLAKGISQSELDHGVFVKGKKIKLLLQAVDEYYKNAFAPEIIYALTLIENAKEAADIIFKYFKYSEEHSQNTSFQESKFQVNLLYIQNQFEKALCDIRIKKNHLIFIDGIDIRPGTIPYNEYLECIKGLANAVWSLNNDFFPRIKGSKGRFRAVLLLRPDIFNSIGMQNQTNKIKDNSVFLDWRTTYPSYNNSMIFQLADKLLEAQQENSRIQLGQAWDCYFPWKSKSTSPARDFDHSFLKFLRLSYSRPRDIVTMLKILQENFLEEHRNDNEVFNESDLDGHVFQNKYSEYLMGSVKDQLSFYYSDKDYEMFLNFFSYLNGKIEFSYKEYTEAYNKFIDFILQNHDNIPEFVEKPDLFLQFLYDTNIICYIEHFEETSEPLFRWCYRERSPSNLLPKVKVNLRYRIHSGLSKALNVGFMHKK